MSCFLEFRHSCLYKLVCLHFASVPLDRPSWSCIHMKKMTPQYCFIVIIHIIKAQHYVIVYLQKLSYEGRDDCQQKRVRLHLWCRSFNSIGRPQKLILPDRRSSLKQCLVALNWSPIVMTHHPSELCHFSFSEKIPQPLLGQSFDSASGQRVCRKAFIALWEKMILGNSSNRSFFCHWF